MPCNDTDVGGEPATATTLILGEGFSTDFNSDCGDTDYFQISLEKGRNYSLSFFTREGNLPHMFGMLDFNSVSYLESGAATSTVNRLTSGYVFSYRNFTARYDGDHFVLAQYSSDLPYSVTVRQRLADRASSVGVRRFLPLFRDVEMIDQFEDGDEGDVFTYNTSPGRKYSLEIVGDANVDPWIGTVNDERTYYDAGTGNRARIEFVAGDTNQSFVNVGGTGVGEYRISLKRIDGDQQAVGPNTRAILTPDGSVIESDIDTQGDIDWFRAPMTEGNWYRATLQRSSDGFKRLTSPLLIVRNPDSTVQGTPVFGGPSDNAPLQSYFQADQTGDHFIIARSSSELYTGTYTIGLEELRSPISPKFQSEENETSGTLSFEIRNDQTIALSNTFQAPEAATEYEIFTGKVNFRRDGTSLPTSSIVSVPAEELEQWSIAAGANGASEFLVRANTGGKWSRWLSRSIESRTVEQAILSGQSFDTSEIRFSFVTELPVEFGTEYTGFEQVSPFLSTPIIENIWDAQWGQGFLRHDHESNGAEIRVFLADNVDGYYEAFSPGEGRGGDIVLNGEIFNEDLFLKRGSREWHELQRAMGEAIGLQQEPTVSRFESVMGGGELSEAPYAVTPMAADRDAIRELYGVNRFFGADRDLVGTGYELTRNFDEQEFLTVQGELLSHHFDLRPGKQSFLIDEAIEEQKLTIVSNSKIRGAAGGSGNNRLFGNSGDNRLISRSGNDYLQGFGGDDLLQGGNGSDWYGYRFGDGDDTIEESKATSGSFPGRDTLRLQGFGPFDLGNLEDSVTFRRLGTDLHVELALDDGPADGSVKIHQQAYGSFRVETIELFQDGVRSSPRISLVSVFSQLADGESKRFAATDQSSKFGLLVAPV